MINKLKLLPLLLTFGLLISAKTLKIDYSLEFIGKIKKDLDISAIAYKNNYLIIGSDEGNGIQILKKTPNQPKYQVITPFFPLINSKDEVDIEGITISDSVCYITGSHSLLREKLKPKKSLTENFNLIKTITSQANRYNIFRVIFNPISGQLSPITASISLREILNQDPVLKIFTNIPGKENGIDIEGVATDSTNDNLYIAFRSPVLRENNVPVLVTKFSNPMKYKLLYIDLKGNGIRDITKVNNGFLLIAGPSGDNEGNFYLYFWNGKSGIPDNNKSLAQLRKLGEIPTPKGTKAEGLAVLQETEQNYHIIVVYDSAPKGNPQVIRALK